MVKFADLWHRLVYLILLGTSVTVSLTSAIFALLTLIESTSDDAPYMPVIRLVIGGLEVLVAALAIVAMLTGGFGLLMGKSTLVLTYILLHVGICVLQVGFTSVYVGFTYAPSLVPADRRDLLNSYIKNSSIMEMDRVQIDQHCCGVDGYTDWSALNTPWYQRNKDSLLFAPPSCCRQPNSYDNCTASVDLIFAQGCLKSVLSVIEGSALKVAISNGILIFVQIPAIFLSGHLHYTLVKHSRYDVL